MPHSLPFAYFTMDEELVAEFKKLISEDVAVPVCAMKSLTGVIRRSTASTWMRLEKELRASVEILKHTYGCGGGNSGGGSGNGMSSNIGDLRGRTPISLVSGCELFMKFVSATFLSQRDFDACRDELLLRGQSFADMSYVAREAIASVGHSFVQEGSVVLTHGCSRVVSTLLFRAATCGKQFRVIVTEGSPANDGAIAAKQLNEAGIPTTLIPDSAVGLVMSGGLLDKVDLCLVGAEGVVETGGVVNKVGTLQIAMVAKALNVPVYVAVESYKFARSFPLTARDIHELISCGGGGGGQGHGSESSGAWGRSTAASAEGTSEAQQQVEGQEQGQGQGQEVGVGVGSCSALPSVDFTPAEYITLLFTDLGVLTPAAVSDELIRMMMH